MLEPLFIDTGGIDLLVDPNESSILRFWKGFPADAVHATSHIVYWEFMRRFSPTENSLIRQRFVKYVEKKRIAFTVFGERERGVAIRIYHGVKQALEDNKSAGAKSKLAAMHNDIMIASEAIVLGRRVLTQDVGDWAQIRETVKRKGLGLLNLIDKKDLQNS